MSSLNRRKQDCFFGQTIFTGGEWLLSLANIKGAKNDVKIYVGRSTTVNNLLFCPHALRMNDVIEMFLFFFFAFDEVERKPNFNLRLFRVGLPVHAYRQKKQIPVTDTKMATPLDFCRGMSRSVNWYRLMPRHVIRHVANM